MSASSIVDNLWAIIIVVLPFETLSIASFIYLSFIVSSAEVASSLDSENDLEEIFNKYPLTILNISKTKDHKWIQFVLKK